MRRVRARKDAAADRAARPGGGSVAGERPAPARDPAGAACAPEEGASCAICADEGIVMEVIDLPAPGVARVRAPGGRPARAVAIDLLEDVRPGDRLVVHLGFAIARVRDTDEHEESA